LLISDFKILGQIGVFPLSELPLPFSLFILFSRKYFQPCRLLQKEAISYSSMLLKKIAAPAKLEIDCRDCLRLDYAVFCQTGI